MKSRSETPATAVAVVGDVHGHLQLACCVAARWQQELGVAFEAVLLCGDVGTFTDESQLDSATRGHAKKNPCEIEFLTQWATRPQAPWLDYIFRPAEDGGLGLTCPVIMVHGNHEGFAHLEHVVPATFPNEPVTVQELPAMDTGRHISILPSGWRVRLPSGCVIGGIGGIQPGQRRANYHPMAYLSEEAVLYLMEYGPVDILATHQGPAGLQGEKGARLLQPLLDEGIARVWFHGHSIAEPEVRQAGPSGRSLVIPLGDIAFHVPQKYPRQREPYHPGTDGWAWVRFGGGTPTVHKETPRFLREYCRHRWMTKGDLLVCPPLMQFAWPEETP